MTVIDLRSRLRAGAGFAASEQTAGDAAQVLILRLAGKHYALSVDGAGEIRPAVIEDFAAGKLTIPGIAGATLLLDGTIVPILDLREIINGN